MKNKQGKPVSISSSGNRRHSITLNEKAEFILRKVCRNRTREFNFSRYVSERVIDDFEGDYTNDLNMELVRVSELQAKYFEKQQGLIRQIRRSRSLEESRVIVGRL